MFGRWEGGGVEDLAGRKARRVGWACFSFAFPFLFFSIYFLGGTGSRRTGIPNMTAGRCEASRKNAGRGRDKAMYIRARKTKGYSHALNEQLLHRPWPGSGVQSQRKVRMAL